MRLTFAEQLNKMITAGLGGNVEAPETSVAVGRGPVYTEIGPAPLLTFQTNAAVPFKALSVDMLPIQDLNGQDHPWAPGGGKNLFNVPAESYTMNGVTMTSNSDGSVTLTGDANSAAYLYTRILPYEIPTGTPVTVSLNNIETDASVGARLVYVENNNITSFGTQVLANSADKKQTVTETFAANALNIFVKTNHSDVDITLKIQVELGTEATDWTPYANICPISGHDEVNIWRNDTYDETAEPAVTFQFDDTVYGGSLDVTRGVLTVNRAIIASYDGETLPGEWISDRDEYAPGTTPSTGAQVCYELAQPITVQLTAQQLAALNGTNNVWSDGGDVSLTYTTIQDTIGY